MFVGACVHYIYYIISYVFLYVYLSLSHSLSLSLSLSLSVIQGSTDVVSLLKESQQVHQTLSSHELQQLLSVNVKVQNLGFRIGFRV